jgi:hypothetical protein
MNTPPAFPPLFSILYGQIFAQVQQTSLLRLQPIQFTGFISHLTNSNGYGILCLGFVDVSPSSPSLSPQPRVYPQPSGFRRACPPDSWRAFVFIILRIAFPATPLVSQSPALPQGVTLQRTPMSSHLCALRASAVRKSKVQRLHLHNFGAPITTFKINTCKSVSKQETLSVIMHLTQIRHSGMFLVSEPTHENDRCYREIQDR